MTDTPTTLPHFLDSLYTFDLGSGICPECGFDLITDPLLMKNTSPKPQAYCEVCGIWFYELHDAEVESGELVIKPGLAN